MTIHEQESLEILVRLMKAVGVRGFKFRLAPQSKRSLEIRPGSGPSRSGGLHPLSQFPQRRRILDTGSTSPAAISGAYPVPLSKCTSAPLSTSIDMQRDAVAYPSAPCAYIDPLRVSGVTRV